jgi:glutathione synthase
VLAEDGKDTTPVSVVYFRSGYSPTDYPTEIEWDARKLIESSNAIKCPSVAYQLVGTKKIQQTLCVPGVLEKFLTQENADKLRKCFAKQFSLGSMATPEALAAMEEAIAGKGEKWVLKPQREGGGNNFYGQELASFLLANKNNDVLSGYVLMQRIFPKAQQSVCLKKGKVSIVSSISELGIYGVFLGDGSDDVAPMYNQCAGYLLRTKPLGVDEGGVATGYSVLSSILLE